MLMPKRYCLVCLKRYALLLVIGSIAVFALLNLYIFDTSNWGIHSTMPTSKNNDEKAQEHILLDSLVKDSIISKMPSEAELKKKAIRDKVERLSKRVKDNSLEEMYTKPLANANYNVHIFYYPWYRSLQYDNEWQHWNHEYIPNWKKDDPKVYPTGRHKPPDDIGSNFYPAIGCYSSRDPKVIDIHMKQIREAGIGVIVVSWYPPNVKDASDEVFSLLLDAAKKFELHVAPHLEPYDGRNVINLKSNIQYFFEKFGKHESLHRMSVNEKELPVFYIYDSYRIDSEEWKELLDERGQLSLRQSEWDGVYFGLVVDEKHTNEIKKSHFDGFYTYFASNGFSYGSSWKNWLSLSKFANEHKLLFSPSVGPGYIDTRVRPWNAANSKHRRHGRYYQSAWSAALSSIRPQALTSSIISITSFNEWHEGTQIEPAGAAPPTTAATTFNYLDYNPQGSDFYLNLTRFWVTKFNNKINNILQ